MLAEHYLNDLFLTVSGALQSEHGQARNIKANAYDESGAKQAPVLSRIAEYVDQNLSEDIALGDIAKYGGIEERRIGEACRLLLEKNYTVTEVVELCGYRSLYYFCKVFKNQIGKTPIEYKRS